jgi:hypothetical protein
VSNKPSGKPLAFFGSEQISALVRAMPGLADVWARAARIDAHFLERGQARALATLRVAMTGQNDLFLTSLAHTGIHHIADAHDTSGFCPDAAESSRMHVSWCSTLSATRTPASAPCRASACAHATRRAAFTAAATRRCVLAPPEAISSSVRQAVGTDATGPSSSP